MNSARTWLAWVRNIVGPEWAGLECDHRFMATRGVHHWAQSVLRDAEIAGHKGDAGHAAPSGHGTIW